MLHTPLNNNASEKAKYLLLYFSAELQRMQERVRQLEAQLQTGSQAQQLNKADGPAAVDKQTSPKLAKRETHPAQKSRYKMNKLMQIYMYIFTLLSLKGVKLKTLSTLMTILQYGEFSVSV